MIDWKIALDSLKAAQSAAERYTDLPLKHALITAYDGILQTKEQALAMQEDLHEARRIIMELERQLTEHKADPKDGLQFENQAYWASESREHGPDGPFCMHCLDRGDGRRRLLPHQHTGTCPECRKSFVVWPERREPSPPKPQRGTVWNSGY